MSEQTNSKPEEKKDVRDLTPEKDAKGGGRKHHRGSKTKVKEGGVNEGGWDY